ncbi:hypothetical protein GCM10007933_15290 [Zoogloea oryzae]|uniref:Uncharacterized protein n=1 Tax=Zoogloea oryzae TaxID=310767 RepID=A0ABQ6F936_9RHOO|nr:hypothetical protein [Zoogloea oryzae]GLT22073.1 hypothetical protein GCM10007933_15290 [Zoogloea oryzae]
MRINLAHLRERAQSGGWINFAVFDARSSSGSSDDNASLLAQLTAKARGANLQVDQSALAFMSGSRIQFFGSPPLVEYLSNNGLPGWTHTIDA